jgi:phosphodiesterase/alkaline phosphatase D-like protein
MLTGLQPKFVLAGQFVNTGGVVSTTVMIWSHVAELLQASVAVQVRVIVKLPGQLPDAVASLKVMRTLVPQKSIAVAMPVKLVAV